jgi:lipoyl(octanoyl) transferase
MIVRELGQSEYLPTWHAMRDFTAGRTATSDDELWLVEHPPVFTLGQAGRREHLLADTPIPVVLTDRGGQITYHGPGQVVAYPLVDLRRLGIFVKELVFRIEHSVIQTLAAYDIDARRVPGAPGVYVPWREGPTSGPFAGLAKIAALGIKVSHGRSYHGVALNVAMDLVPFSLINPCGYAGLPAIDLATIGVSARPATVAAQLAERLTAHLSARTASA